jgi:hypothetical protein
MEIALIVALLLVHLYFLYYTFMNVGILWTIAVVVIPILGLYIYYREWPDLKIVFFIQLSLALVLAYMTRS